MKNNQLTTHLKIKISRSKKLALSFIISLLIFLIIKDAVFNKIFTFNSWIPWSIIIMKIIPIFLVLPGMIKGHARSFAWCCYIVNIYFIIGILNIFTPNMYAVGWIEVSLSFMLFISSLLYTRWKFHSENKNQM